MPRDVRLALGLDTEPLAYERLADDGWVAGTRVGIHVLRGTTVTSRAWTDVDGARLDPETDTLTLTWVDGTAPLPLALAEGWHPRFPRLVHHQVQASVVHSERVTVPRAGAVRVALRRGADGGLFTQVIGNGRVDLGDPATVGMIDAAEARVRESAGL